MPLSWIIRKTISFLRSPSPRTVSASVGSPGSPSASSMPLTAWTVAVRVNTPSRSNRHARTLSGRPITTPPPYDPVAVSSRLSPAMASFSGRASKRFSFSACSAGLTHSSEQEHQTDQRDQQAQEHHAQEPDEASTPEARECVPQGMQNHRRQESAENPPIQGGVPYLEPFPPQDGAHQSGPRHVPGRRAEAAHQKHLVEDAHVALRL